MTKAEALKLIDEHKNKQVDPVNLLHWTWLRVIILKIPDDQWNEFVGEACEQMAR